MESDELVAGGCINYSVGDGWVGRMEGVSVCRCFFVGAHETQKEVVLVPLRTRYRRWMSAVSCHSSQILALRAAPWADDRHRALSTSLSLVLSESERL